MNDLIDWIGSPEAYNWITLIGALAAMLTAAFTGYTAWQSWSDRRQRVTFEWSHNASIEQVQRLNCTVINRLTSTLFVERVEVVGPVASVFDGRRREDKHPSWAHNQAPIFVEVEPGKKESFQVLLSLDPSAVREASKSFRSRTPRWVRWLFWKSLGWRVLGGVKFRITLMAYRRSSPWRIRRPTHTIKMNADTLLKIAETIEAKADKT